MKKTVTIKENRTFRRIYSKGRSAVTPFLVLYCRPNRLDHNRLGVTVSTKPGGAVVRNRARRRIRELYRTHERMVSAGYDIVIVARTRVMFGRYAELERSFCQLMKKLGLLLPNGDKLP